MESYRRICPNTFLLSFTITQAFISSCAVLWFVIIANDPLYREFLLLYYYYVMIYTGLIL